MEESDAFVQAVRELVDATSQTEVALKAGLNPSTISRILSGHRMGSMATARKLLTAYPELGRSFLGQNMPTGIS